MACWLCTLIWWKRTDGNEPAEQLWKFVKEFSNKIFVESSLPNKWNFYRKIQRYLIVSKDNFKKENHTGRENRTNRRWENLYKCCFYLYFFILNKYFIIHVIRRPASYYCCWHYIWFCESCQARQRSPAILENIDSRGRKGDLE